MKPKFETLVIAIFCFAIIVWAWSKCSSKKAELSQRRASEEEVDTRPAAARRDTIHAVQPKQVVVQQAPAPPPQQTVGGYAVARPGAAPQVQAVPQARPAQPVQHQAAPPPAPQTVVENRTVLYGTIEGLKVHKEPGTKSPGIDKLKLYEEVYFLNTKTDWEEELSLAFDLPAVKDHWVKIRTKRGKEGWVFGAGVHYYKMKAGQKQ